MRSLLFQETCTPIWRDCSDFTGITGSLVEGHPDGDRRSAETPRPSSHTDRSSSTRKYLSWSQVTSTVILFVYIFCLMSNWLNKDRMTSLCLCYISGRIDTPTFQGKQEVNWAKTSQMFSDVSWQTVWNCRYWDKQQQRFCLFSDSSLNLGLNEDNQPKSRPCFSIHLLSSN